MKGYENANGVALDLWTEVYPSSLLVALTDTFSTDVFFRVRKTKLFIPRDTASHMCITHSQDFEASSDRAKKWTGLRQDSGDPFLFAPKAKEVYKKLGIDHTSKNIVYSDSLDVDKVLKLKEQCDKEGFPCTPIMSVSVFR